MYLLELVAQGLRGCSPTTRAALSPGYVVLRPPGAEPVPLAGVISALLYSDGRGGDVAFRAAGAAFGKAGVTLQGNDLGTYRVVRELGGAGSLQRLNKTTQKFELVTQDTLEMGQFLRGQVGAPGKSAFEQLFSLDAHSFPSKRPKPAPKPGASGERKLPSLATSVAVTAATDIPAAEAKLAELQKELELSKEIDKLQFRQDGLASEMFELEAKLKGTEGLKAAIAETQRLCDEAPTPESLGLPHDIVARCERYPALVQKRDEALARLQAEKGGDDAAMPAPAAQRYVPEPFFRDPRFLGGAGVGVLVLVLGMALRAGIGRYVALLDIPAFGFAALVALKWVDDLQGAQRSGRKEGMLAAREKKILEEFEQEAQQVKAAMRQLSVESPQEVIDLLSQRALYAERLHELKTQLAAMESDPEFAQAAQRYAALKAESDAISQQLQERAGGYVRDPREVEREIQRVRESIELARNGPPPQPESPAATPAPGGGFEDPTPGVFALAADLFQLDVPSLAALIKDRCAQYVAALCDRRYVGVEVDHKANATLIAPDRRVPASDLPAKDLDLYYLALRLTLVEKHSAKMKLPLVIDDVLGAVVEEARLPLLGRMLKHLGTLTQVLHVTRHPTPQSMADAVVTL
ncbi:MAG: chromosome segregation protein SMC [Myxococcaceae bacterium]|nr:chromosome segregation protein SMC [Myxococcaceae bacterium]